MQVYSLSQGGDIKKAVSALVKLQFIYNEIKLGGAENATLEITFYKLLKTEQKVFLIIEIWPVQFTAIQQRVND